MNGWIVKPLGLLLIVSLLLTGPGAAKASDKASFLTFQGTSMKHLSSKQQKMAG